MVNKNINTASLSDPMADPLFACDIAVLRLLKEKFENYPAERVPRYLVFEIICSFHFSKKELSMFLVRLDKQKFITNSNYGISFLPKKIKRGVGNGK